MGARLLPRNLPELFSYSLVLEREATKRYAELEHYLRAVGEGALADEFEKLGREEREQYELIALGTSERELPELAGWELIWYFSGSQLEGQRAPRSSREAVALALDFERRTQAFYNDVADNARGDALRAFAAEMANDEQRHVSRLEALLLRETQLAAYDADAAGDGLPPLV
jgi:hypothetical protein